jgi:hypothetical protein
VLVHVADIAERQGRLGLDNQHQGQQQQGRQEK